MWQRNAQDQLKRFGTDDQGVTATEYAVCLALLVLGTILAVTALGEQISQLFPSLSTLI